jgi:hypothetical protein
MTSSAVTALKKEKNNGSDRDTRMRSGCTSRHGGGVFTGRRNRKPAAKRGKDVFDDDQ